MKSSRIVRTFKASLLLAIGSLAIHTGAASAQSYLFDVAGTFDGSDTIDLSGSQASWVHNNFAFPSNVALNGVAWNPAVNSTLSLGTTLGSLSASNYAVRLVSLAGRDAATARINSSGALQLDVDDTPNGTDFYHFKVALIPMAPAPTSPATTLTIAGTIDGSEVLTIDKTQAAWSHKFWSTPSNVTVNGAAWNPNTTPVLPNSGATAFLNNNVSFDGVTITKNSGRDLVGINTHHNQAAIYFADNPLGADNYNVTLTFPGNALAAPADGDANSDGVVNFTDLLQIEPHFGATNSTWTTGDFDLDGTTAAPDLKVLAQNYAGAPTPAQLSQLDPTFESAVQTAFAAVPEPGCVMIFAVGGIAFLHKRRVDTHD